MRTGYAFAMGTGGVVSDAAVPHSLSLTAGEDGTVSIDGATGAIMIEILAPPEFAGTYTQDIDGNTLTESLVLANRFVCLVRPVLSGTPFVGLDLSTTDGLWIYTGAEPTFTYQWTGDGVAILGAVSGTYTLAPSNGLQTVTATVIATEGGDSGNATSNGVVVDGAIPFIDDFSTYSDGQNLIATAGYSQFTANSFGGGTHQFIYRSALGAAEMKADLNSRQIYYLHDAALGANQSVEIEFAGDLGPEQKLFGPVARASGASGSGTGYELWWNEYSYVIQIGKRVNASYTTLATWNNEGANYTLQDGDRLRLTVEGTAPAILTGELRPAATGVWQTLFMVEDASSPIPSGSAGIFFASDAYAAEQSGYIRYFYALG